jgi:hypothetical protein
LAAGWRNRTVWAAKPALVLSQRGSASETNPRHAHQLIPEIRANEWTSETNESGTWDEGEDV